MDELKIFFNTAEGVVTSIVADDSDFGYLNEYDLDYSGVDDNAFWDVVFSSYMKDNRQFLAALLSSEIDCITFYMDGVASNDETFSSVSDLLNY